MQLKQKERKTLDKIVSKALIIVPILSLGIGATALYLKNGNIPHQDITFNKREYSVEVRDSTIRATERDSLMLRIMADKNKDGVLDSYSISLLKPLRSPLTLEYKGNEIPACVKEEYSGVFQEIAR